MKKNQFDSSEQSCNTDNCQVREALLIIGGKWKNMILYALGKLGVIRFNQLKRMIPEISQKMLTQQLRELERDGIIKRKAYPEIPPRVEYSITDLGLSMGYIYEAIHQWQQENHETIEKCRSEYDASS